VLCAVCVTLCVRDSCVVCVCMGVFFFTASAQLQGLRHAMNDGSWQDLDPVEQMVLLHDKMLGWVLGTRGGAPVDTSVI
jgi:hypothetical protein